MNRILRIWLIVVFAVFIGSQITEGCLLVPYWKSLNLHDFFSYYSTFGPLINRFYTILTIVAVLIPIGTSIYCYITKADALKYSLLSTIFACLIIVAFYAYFKGANQQFFDASLDANQLKIALTNWEIWHWVRVFFELCALFFLIITFKKLR